MIVCMCRCFREDVLSSIIMKCFEQLVRACLLSTLPPSDTPFHSHTAPTVLRTPPSPTWIRETRMWDGVHRLELRAQLTPLCWQTSFPSSGSWVLTPPFASLTSDGRSQGVRMGNLTSSTLTLSLGAPQGCILSPLLITSRQIIPS